MDIDNGPSEGSGNGTMEIEQSLLQQFSCMGTTDKDELVQQLQKLLGSSLNYSTAAFFLDMNNWNLQAAVCSYLDIESSTKLPSMALVQNPVASESESIEPNTSFQKVWHMFNNGTEQWPQGCYAQCSDGNNLNGGRVPVPALKPSEDTHLTVRMTSPPSPGVYQSKWRLCTEKGAYFGDPMWVIVTVVEEGTMALTQQLSSFSELGASPPAQVAYNPFIPQRSHLEQTQDTTPPPGGRDMW
ncbi:protein ILRUN [Tribolium madens]|uniref:protein ILRUN n=1 Tax=Tribolium madens TaxID=41895 RepID=UPI001CF736D4|nr:protein ILRUN [Tribolium madens]